MYTSSDAAVVVGLSRTDPDVDYKTIQYGIGKAEELVDCRTAALPRIALV